MALVTERLLTLLQHEAKNTAYYLGESWKRPVRHNMGLEQTALWHTVALEMHCETAADRDADHHVVPLLLEYGGPEVRYGVEAAIQMIPRLLPFADSGLAKLRAASDRAYPETMAEREPQLVAHWHRWLWEASPHNVNGETSPESEDHGRSSELALSSSQLASGLEVVLGLGTPSD